MNSEFISISCIPSPTFIEGDYVTFEPGDRHPDRNNLPYFILIVVTRGQLFISEDGRNMTVSPGESVILLPNHHHYSWKATAETTEYYWLHFAVTSEWEAGPQPTPMRSTVEVPILHYHTPQPTLYLLRQHRIEDPKTLHTLFDRLFAMSTSQMQNNFWPTQQLFLDVLQMIQIVGEEETAPFRLARQVRRYLDDHFNESITSRKLSQVFHLHSSYIIRSFKSAMNMTPNEYLIAYRMERAYKALANTDLQVQRVGEMVGYPNPSYFATTFRRRYGMSPSDVRMLHLVRG
ncbi:helix-turn-helix transcriptional regulator [Bifidobacterium simiarum]|uniref:helix-turn-helix transcriptional regulator n=1 Tax=Bifidobacterium simiarum TaxID=2045441 RepID=UPI001BDD17F6|nr:helix-turn-helix domain-containing protein [Bifidobacterium simiarum]MBT1165653.1 helix-turn-helix transcriptional regulator [Bifidobacterium simiarum]